MSALALVREPSVVARLAELGPAELVQLGTRALAEAGHEIGSIQAIKATAAAVRAAQRAVGASQEAIDAATEISLRAKRQLGEAIDAQPKQGPGEHWAEKRGENSPATLAKQGIDKDDAKEARALAAASREQFEAAIEQAKENGRISESVITATLKAAKANDWSWEDIKREIRKHAPKQSEPAPQTAEDLVNLRTSRLHGFLSDFERFAETADLEAIAAYAGFATWGPPDARFVIDWLQRYVERWEELHGREA